MPSVDGARTPPNSRVIGPVPEQVEVVDAVRAGKHARNDARGLDHWVRLFDAQVPAEQFVQARGLGQSHHRNQPGGRREARVIKTGVTVDPG